MTTVTFHLEGSRIVSFESAGHSGFAQEGEDIVCAAVTSTIRLVECAINDVLGLEASVKVDPVNTKISLKLPGKLPEQAENTCQTLLAAMMLYLADLHMEYPENITVLEV
jgi:uncharacterized protein YsxB (DUF464 family)